MNEECIYWLVRGLSEWRSREFRSIIINAFVCLFLLITGGRFFWFFLSRQKKEQGFCVTFAKKQLDHLR